VIFFSVVVFNKVIANSSIYGILIFIMLDKQSKVLKKGRKISKEVVKKVAKKVGASKQTLSTGQPKLPDHHFKLVKVKKGSAEMGLFAGEAIKKGELIIEYIGNILTAKEADEHPENEYLFEVSSKKTIDGSPTWNIARYANHACEEAANAESEIKKERVFIRAVKNIKEGEEITFDYGEEFVKEHILPFGCRCIAKNHSYGARGVSK
jgi:hypothetical protein